MFSPHVLVPAVIIAAILFLWILRNLRSSPRAERIAQQVLGDDTPEAALRDYHKVMQRLKWHRENMGVETENAEQVESKIDEILAQTDDVA